MPRWGLLHPGAAWISLAAGAGGPIGGDHLRMEVEVGAGAALVVRSVAATLLLPGPHGEQSSSDVSIDVREDATLVWLAGPVIAARGCDHQQITRVNLAPGARLFIQEELVLGRYREPAGSVRQRLRVRVGGRPLYDQELHVGPDAIGSRGPAVAGGRGAIGSLLIVDHDDATTDAFGRTTVAPDVTTARLPLPGPATLITSLAPDLLSLRHRLASSLDDLEQDVARSHSPSPTHTEAANAT